MSTDAPEAIAKALRAAGLLTHLAPDETGVARPLDSEEDQSWDTQSETDEAESTAHIVDSPATTHDTKMQTQPSYATGTKGTEGTTRPGARIGESTGLTEAETRTRPECEHCPDGHRVHQPWGAFVASERDSDGQPTHIVVMPTAGAHVAESDAEWIRNVLNGRSPAPVDREKLARLLVPVANGWLDNAVTFDSYPDYFLDEADRLLAALAVSPAPDQPEDVSEMVDAWLHVADHPALKPCYDEEGPLLDSVLDRLTQLADIEATVNELAPAQARDEWETASTAEQFDALPGGLKNE